MHPLTDVNILPLATAIGGGFLIGVERERRKGRGVHRALAGVRTFTLAAVAGALAQQLAQPWLVAGGAVLILVLTAIAYWRDRSADPGVTTELALFVTFLLGVASVAHPASAGAGYVLVAALLGARSRLHRFSTELLTSNELTDALVLAGAALVILPLVPNSNLMWLGGLNPRRVWTLAVVIMGLEAAGHVGMRTIGAAPGLALAGFSSGFVSSTATIAAFGARARQHPRLVHACVAGALFSTVATFVQLGVVTAAAHSPSLPALVPPLALGLVVTLLVAGLSLRAATDGAQGLLPGSHAFSVRRALAVAAGLAGLTTLVGFAHGHFGTQATVVAAAIAGLADVHAATAAVLSLASTGQIDGSSVRAPVFAALAANTISKLVAAWWSGGAGYAGRLAPGLVLGTAAAWAAGGLR